MKLDYMSMSVYPIIHDVRSCFSDELRESNLHSCDVGLHSAASHLPHNSQVIVVFTQRHLPSDQRTIVRGKADTHAALAVSSGALEVSRIASR